jgi:hypothetical protein
MFGTPFATPLYLRRATAIFALGMRADWRPSSKVALGQ